MNLTVITNRKPIINTQTRKRKEIKHVTKESHQTTRKRTREEERNREELLKHPEKSNKMTIKCIFINNYFKCQWTKCSN